jgi:hypothetical protein
MAEKNPKRDELKSKVKAAEARNAKREKTVNDYAKEAADGATSFVKEHPITTLVGGLALGVLIASVLPGPGRRLRKNATAKGGVLAAAAAEAAALYGAQFLEGASKAARAGQDKFGDLGDALGDGTRSLRKDAAGVADSAGDAARAFGSEAGKAATRFVKDLRSRLPN